MSQWVNKTRNISKGNLVLVVADNVPRSHWPLASVVDTYPGEDGDVRSANVETPTRLCILEMSR